MKKWYTVQNLVTIRTPGPARSTTAIISTTCRDAGRYLVSEIFDVRHVSFSNSMSGRDGFKYTEAAALRLDNDF